jgi:hypothetical protein
MDVAGAFSRAITPEVCHHLSSRYLVQCGAGLAEAGPFLRTDDRVCFAATPLAPPPPCQIDALTP